MVAFGTRLNFMLVSGFGILILLAWPTMVDSSRSTAASAAHSTKTTQPDSRKLTPQLSFQIELHGFLLWSSFGFLMPVGILLIRLCNRVECGKKLKVLFYSHVILQVIAVLLATAGAALSLKSFENTFSNTHQRIGLALYALIWVQPLIGFFRPHRGARVRSIWYTVHWLFGTGITLLGIINIYIGLHAYNQKTSRSVKLLSILFILEILVIGFLYLLQDRWDYIQKQGVILGDDQIRPTDHVYSISPRSGNHRKEIFPMY